ncbi:MAG: D-TA family PLP-dependent enzyme [Verrucomicrobia bacterium]|nr:D-TA family PLP-dependent enzyme [Verrucomicrobiota bacterium]
MRTPPASWYQIANLEEVPSPALLVYPERIEENLRRMIARAGGTARLFPHVKTHKLAEVVRLQRTLGIERFKCATVAEAEMVAGCGAGQVLLAHQPVGPNLGRLLELVARFPATRFGAIVDTAAIATALAAAAHARATTLELLVDIDCGMGRTGLAAGAGAFELYRTIAGLTGARAGGLHVYDGHLRDRDLAARTAAVQTAFAPVRALRAQLEQAGCPVPAVVAGGTPTFPVHAAATDVECSPGTCLLWDAGYAAGLPDLDFLWAATVLTRVISKPRPNRLCLDLGHKAIASENPHPRVKLLEVPDATAVMHSEEHLVIETAQAEEFAVGDALFGVPWHICPTVALHAQAVVVRGGRAESSWRIAARDRRLTI